MLAHYLLFHVVHVLAVLAPASGTSTTPAPTTPLPTVPNPGPVSPISSNGVNLLLGYAKWGSLTACGASALVSGGVIAFGHHSNRPDAADKGKRALLWSLGGGVVTALAIPTLNTIIASIH